MRSLRPPPKVTPPRPPAHLFEPSVEDQYVPDRLSNGYGQDEPPRMAAPQRPEPANARPFDADVEQEMRILENNIRKMMAEGGGLGGIGAAPRQAMPKMMSYSPAKEMPYPDQRAARYDLPEYASAAMDRRVEEDGYGRGYPQALPHGYGAPPQVRNATHDAFAELIGIIL